MISPTISKVISNATYKHSVPVMEKAWIHYRLQVTYVVILVVRTYEVVTVREKRGKIPGDIFNSSAKILFGMSIDVQVAFLMGCCCGEVRTVMPGCVEGLAVSSFSSVKAGLERCIEGFWGFGDMPPAALTVELKG